MKSQTEWTIYRTRFLIKAKQLTEPLAFVDALGREHVGKKGDYVVESCDGARSIARREIFEDIYVPMGPAEQLWPLLRAPRTPPAGRGDLPWDFAEAPGECAVSAGGKRAS